MIYDESLANKAFKKKQPPATLSESSVETGKQLFAEQACSACHAVESRTELLGPNLNGIGNRLSREDILEEINFPSKIIKPSMGALRITRKDGQVLLGRAVNADEKEISLMLIGNSIVKIPRDQIAKIENEEKSLMYEGLIKGLTKQQVDNLLDYILSLP